MKYSILTLFLLMGTGVLGRLSAQTVTLDYHFNHEVHAGKSGTQERFHYMWEDTANTGFSVLGYAFKKHHANF